ncbi:hypothetical protein L210DRAFT_320694 [Boletus edulis BED1]|uniref:Uncharacterized protein n=1 Tax=Boletus edulis BED1 TaxID=1328754 RepID=A0AAD4C0I5_BOLED|nr:hypothetical protein L210DRAFT_320694 [Boletus edulis BED1]
MSESTGNQLLTSTRPLSSFLMTAEACGHDAPALTSFPAGCTASNLLMKKWMGLICPKLRLRVRLPQNREFVSSTVKVHSQSKDKMDFSRVEWLWNDDVK